MASFIPHPPSEPSSHTSSIPSSHPFPNQTRLSDHSITGLGSCRAVKHFTQVTLRTWQPNSIALQEPCRKWGQKWHTSYSDAVPDFICGKERETHCFPEQREVLPHNQVRPVRVRTQKLLKAPVPTTKQKWRRLDHKKLGRWRRAGKVGEGWGGGHSVRGCPASTRSRVQPPKTHTKMPRQWHTFMISALGKQKQTGEIPGASWTESLTKLNKP